MDAYSLPNVFTRNLRKIGTRKVFGADGPTISVIIPTRNEAANLPFVLPKIPEWVDEIILVDGHSTDKTVEVARALCPQIRVITQRKRGKGEALRCGLEAATGDIVVLIDADGSNDPSEIHAFVGALLSGADFAKGTRFMQGAGSADISSLRSLGNWGLTLLVRLLFGGSYTDLCYGYNAFWREFVPVLHLDGDGFEIETEMNIRALRKKLRIFEVPSYEYPRINGVSNLQTFPDGWRVLKTILREFRLKQNEKTVQVRRMDPVMIPVTSDQPAHSGSIAPSQGD